MESTNGKRLLVLGGTAASLDVVRIAKEMGIYVIVTDDNPVPGVAKQIADEIAMVSTADIDGLVELAKQKQVDGIFCGPSEFNLRNVIAATAKAGLPCYTDMQTWDKCANKDVFKQYCRQYDVDCTPEYNIDLTTSMEELEKLDYPIIVKPVDGCSSAGITVCRSADQVHEALEKAYASSKSKKTITEKFIENDGEIFAVRYMLCNGEAYPYFLQDSYVVDQGSGKGLITTFTYSPSKRSQYYMEHMDANVRKMFAGMGLKDGTAFVQALPYKGKIYFHEMGYRLSGGMVFRLTEPLTGIHDIKIMLRAAVGGEVLTGDEITNIDLSCSGKFGCYLMVPLCAGTIGRIEGLDKVKAHKAILDVLQYYHEGDTVEQRVIGTLGQHFCRAYYIVDSME
ncbi:MAG: ATP-grasp domain-containing protein, partial [Oscillospiraceae bacterium]|nr:ATP-grasp domain-containing protein [Oscillospiraceae bacterium]